MMLWSFPKLKRSDFVMNRSMAFSKQPLHQNETHPTKHMHFASEIPHHTVAPRQSELQLITISRHLVASDWVMVAA